MTAFPKRGQWVQWITPEIGRQGQVIDAHWPSLVVKWLGVDEPQVFPLGYLYFEPGSSLSMEYITKPKAAAQVQQQEAKGVLGVQAAAAALGLTPKQVRQKLRAGKLKGTQRDGRWVQVEMP